MKVLIIAHGHPSIHKGGGEVAAYSLFKQLKERGHESCFIGWGGFDRGSNSKRILRNIGQNDYLLYSTTDFFYYSSQSTDLYLALKSVLELFQPEIIHLHHYIHVGVEISAIIKNILPNCRIILTLHEYLAICYNHGQLLTTSGNVCKGYAPENCQQCFPDINANSFFMRELSIKAAFSFIDHFLSPSMFLRDQYILWGIAPDRITAIENPLLMLDEVIYPPLDAPGRGEPWRIGFFGQINFYKGIDIILEGVRMALSNNGNILLGIHGSMSVGTDEHYFEALKKSIKDLGDNAIFHGPFQHSAVKALMSKYHFIIMGSRWYENSPVVIQEALEANRPLIVPAHGGMLEKVSDLGVHYAPGDPRSLERTLTELTSQKYLEISDKVLTACKAMSESRNKHFDETIATYSGLAV